MNKVCKNLIKFILFQVVFPIWYWLCRIGRPVEQKVVFLEVRADRMTNSFHLLYDRYRSEGKYQVTCCYLLVANGGQLAYVKRCMDMIRQVANASIVYLNESSNVFSALPIRKETKVVQTWHGCGAFKRFGYTRQEGLEEAYYKHYDLVTVSSEEVVDIYQQAMRQDEGIVKAIGVSRTDCFFDELYVTKAKEKVTELYPQIQDKKCVLYAPTFRGNVAKPVMPESPDIEVLFKEFGKSHVILYKAHPSIKETLDIPIRCQEFMVAVDDKVTTEELMCASDVCITDYSSLIFEYSLLERPMIFYAYDYEAYCDDRGFYYPYEELVPGPICKNTEDLIVALHNAENNDRHQILQFKRRFMNACDGSATTRIMEYVEHLIDKGV